MCGCCKQCLPLVCTAPVKTGKAIVEVGGEMVGGGVSVVMACIYPLFSKPPIPRRPIVGLPLDIVYAFWCGGCIDGEG